MIESRIKRIVGANPGILRIELEKEIELAKEAIDQMIEKGILVENKGGLKLGVQKT